MKLLVWLGNPGKEYEKTRHNIWFTITSQVVSDLLFSPFVLDPKWRCMLTQGVISWQKVLCIQPLTYMNRSWDSVAQISNFYKILPTDVIVIHDDIDLPVGTVKYKVGGNHAWHNGLKDIIAKLGNADFTRVRIGVGRPHDQRDVSNWVLSSFRSEEQTIIQEKYTDVYTYVRAFLIDV